MRKMKGKDKNGVTKLAYIALEDEQDLQLWID